MSPPSIPFYNYAPIDWAIMGAIRTLLEETDLAVLRDIAAQPSVWREAERLVDAYRHDPRPLLPKTPMAAIRARMRSLKRRRVISFEDNTWDVHT